MAYTITCSHCDKSIEHTCSWRETVSRSDCPDCTKEKANIPTIEKLIEAIKKREKDGKITINDVYAASRDIIFNQPHSEGK
jgi:peptide subunit release factor 1 (eRF1)